MNPVQKLYHIGHAHWYNFFRTLWTRIVESKLEKELLATLDNTITPHTTIIEIGCGTGINIGRILSLRKKFTSYLGIDFSPDMLAIAKQKFGEEKNITLTQGDARTVLLPQQYDLVICTWVLSHLPEPSTVINRFYEKLNSNGSILLVFLTKPHWLVSFWFSPLARLFCSTYVSEKEIQKMHGMKTRISYCAGLATFVIINKPK